MERANEIGSNKKTNLRLTIVWAGLLVGTLDILAAIIQTLLRGGSVVNLFKFIASGVFGKEAFAGGLTYAFSGLIFHYCIAFIWTIFFFLIYTKVRLLSKNKIITGFVYGFFVWLIMNRVVLPLSNTPPIPFRITGAITAMLVLVVAIGLPLSFIANKFYGSRQGL